MSGRIYKEDKDFIVLSVVPPNPDLGDLLEVKRVVPIQLTTDPWEEAGREFDNDTEVSLESNGDLEVRGNGHHVGGSSSRWYG